MNNAEKIEATKALAKLFGSYPQSPMSDPDLQIRAYLETVMDFECVDVLAAVGGTNNIASIILYW